MAKTKPIFEKWRKDKRERFNELAKNLLNWIQSTSEIEIKYSDNLFEIDEELKEKLEELGYLS